MKALEKGNMEPRYNIYLTGVSQNFASYSAKCAVFTNSNSVQYEGR